MSVGATERLSRLLAMVPWLLRRQGVPLSEAAQHFGVTEAQLVKDLELLFVCGTPGHLPDDLIEASWESGRIFLDNADPIARPLRLGVDEAVALLAGLRMLAEVPGLHDREAVELALAKLGAATGGPAQETPPVAVQLAGSAEGTLRAFRQALADRRRLRLRYIVPSRDETTERDVDPMRLTAVDGRWYLEGWCHRAEAVRWFRADRVAGVEILADVPGAPPPEAVSREVDEGLFRPSPDDTVVVLDLRPGAHWVAEYYPVEQVSDLPGGVRRIRVRAAAPEWVPRLVLRLGGQARIVEPEWLRIQAMDAAGEALAAY